MSLSILVVLYRCEIEKSKTIKSILSSNLFFEGINLCIWNNGPKELAVNDVTLKRLEKKLFNITIKQTITNLPLSRIYNHFLDSFSSENHAIIDHDSDLSKNYLNYILSAKDIFVGMPIIKAQGAPHSPTSNGQFSAGPYKKTEKVIAIGSGILINKRAATAIKHAYGNVFDENFALYGVDTSFFIRLNKLGLTENLQSIPGFEHSLSRLETETEEIIKFRKIERSYDFGLSLRHYPTIMQFLTLLKQIALTPLGKNRILITKALKVFIVGQHERCQLSGLK